MIPASLHIQRVYLVVWIYYYLLQVYSADGEFLFKFGSHGEGNGQFNAPTGVAVDANGNIIVADWGNSRIQVMFIFVFIIINIELS